MVTALDEIQKQLALLINQGVRVGMGRAEYPMRYIKVTITETTTASS
jgi:hypothetical protein